MKILNLYSGIGGNRKLWDKGHTIISVENNKDIADVYKSLYPDDTIIVEDAHNYLIQNYNKFDFIWSRTRRWTTRSQYRYNIKGKGFFVR